MNHHDTTTSGNDHNFDEERSAHETRLGWKLLQTGNHQQALEHFKQALIYFPYNETAKSGMVEALKARYWFYRVFLKYAFWMERKGAGAQWGVILGFYFGYRGILFIDKQYPGLSFITGPLIVLYLLFVLTTWIIRPISNLFLRLNSYGRFALNQEEIKCSNFLAISFSLAIISVVAYIATGQDLFTMTGFFFLTMSMPLASLFEAPSHSNARKFLILYAITMGVLGASAIAVFLSGGEVMNKFSGFYMLALFIYQWVANAILIR